jgi:uncharacterized protein (DUF1778 family)
MGSMAKVTISIDERALDAVDQAATAAGMSRSQFVAQAAEREAMRSARLRLQAALTAHTEFADAYTTANDRALRRGAEGRSDARARHEVDG